MPFRGLTRCNRHYPLTFLESNDLQGSGDLRRSFCIPYAPGVVFGRRIFVMLFESAPASVPRICWLAGVFVVVRSALIATAGRRLACGLWLRSTQSKVGSLQAEGHDRVRIQLFGLWHALRLLERLQGRFRFRAPLASTSPTANPLSFSACWT
jgi:hypothetical protein